MADRVRSGDPDNVEATAAQAYFPALFSPCFTRQRYEDGINAALNYGYAILRGCAARALAAYGFQPALGLHHRSTLNAFNLADDVMESFRPTVDLLVFRTVADEDELTPRLKQVLFNVLNLDILMENKHHSVSYAMELTVQGLARALEKGEPQLSLPRLLELNQHGYE
jgi:CRISPR-associated protein Cas1